MTAPWRPVPRYGVREIAPGIKVNGCWKAADQPHGVGHNAGTRTCYIAGSACRALIVTEQDLALGLPVWDFASARFLTTTGRTGATAL